MEGELTDVYKYYLGEMGIHLFQVPPGAVWHDDLLDGVKFGLPVSVRLDVNESGCGNNCFA